MDAHLKEFLHHKEFFIADLNGIYAQHANMWTVYDSSIKMLLAVSSFPILVAGVLVQSKSIDILNFANLPEVLTYSFLITPIISFVVVAVIIHYRLTILLYARALNRYRGFYAQGIPFDPSPMPIDSDVPKLYEPVGPMGLIVHGAGIVNAFYVVFALWNVIPLWKWEVARVTPITILAALVYVVALELWYWFSSGRSQPWRRAPKRNRALTSK